MADSDSSTPTDPLSDEELAEIRRDTHRGVSRGYRRTQLRLLATIDAKVAEVESLRAELKACREGWRRV